MKIFNIVLAVCFTALGLSYMVLGIDLPWWAASTLMFAIALDSIKDIFNDS
jgi:hypothetical protein